MLEALLQTPAAPAVRRRLFVPGETLHAPHLLDVEVAQVIRRYALAGEIDSERGQAALGTLATFPLRRYPHHVLLPRVWQLRSNLSAYDAVYVALAEVLEAPLLTCDRRLVTAAGRHASIELIEAK